MSDNWQNNVTNARKAGKSLYFVEYAGTVTVEATTSLDAALAYRAESARPHLYTVFRQDGPYLTRVG